MTTDEQPDPNLEAAMDRIVRLRDRPADRSARAELEAWLAADPDHLRAWDQARRTWQLVGKMPPVMRETWSAPARTGRRSRRCRIGLGVVAAALAACLVLAVAPSLLLRIQADHVTGTAETRRVALTDGSIAELGPESAIATRFTAGQRRVSLISGTAFFEVAPDAGRPFVVDAAGIEATALGTAFDVRLSTRSVSVGVASGTVGIRHEGAVSPDIARLGPGERAHVDRETGAATLDRVAPDAVASWRDGRLFVADATVAEVVEELRRYHAGWIVIADDRLAAAQVNGLYDLRDPGRALRAVVQPAGGLVRRVTPLLYVLSRP